MLVEEESVAAARARAREEDRAAVAGLPPAATAMAITSPCAPTVARLGAGSTAMASADGGWSGAWSTSTAEERRAVRESGRAALVGSGKHNKKEKLE